MVVPAAGPKEEGKALASPHFSHAVIGLPEIHGFRANLGASNWFLGVDGDRGGSDGLASWFFGDFAVFGDFRLPA